MCVCVCVMYIYKTKFSSRNRVATKSRLYRPSLISYYDYPVFLTDEGPD